MVAIALSARIHYFRVWYGSWCFRCATEMHVGLNTLRSSDVENFRIIRQNEFN
jgi:hypothetical protein